MFFGLNIGEQMHKTFIETKVLCCNIPQNDFQNLVEVDVFFVRISFIEHFLEAEKKHLYALCFEN